MIDMRGDRRLITSVHTDPVEVVRPKVAEYVIVHGNAIRIREDIERWLADGWELQGGISVSLVFGFWYVFHQAMVKYK